MEEKNKCQSDIQNLEKQINIRLECIDKIIVAEIKRIDSNRTTDVSSVVLANEKAIAQASILVNQVVSSDEALRSLINNINNLIDERLMVLEKSRYESEGRKSLSTSLLIMISSLIGGLIVFIIEKLISL